MPLIKVTKKGKQIHAIIQIGIFRISWYELTWKKVSIRFQISWGWDYKKYEN